MPGSFPSATKTWHTAPYDEIDPNRLELSLEGKSALITGGGGSIGGATARAFAAAGITNLALVGRRLDPLNMVKKDIEATSKTKVHVYSGDITDKAAMENIMSSFSAQIGQTIDVLVSNAGGLAKVTSIADADHDDWWQGFCSNALGGFVTVRAFLKVSSPNATIINVSSGIAHIPPTTGFSAHAASKAATARMIEYLQYENPTMRMFNLQPGSIASDLSRKAGRGAMPDEETLPGAFMTWLCSGEAGFLKGRYLWANWDVSELRAMKTKIEESSLFTMTLEGWPFASLG